MTELFERHGEPFTGTPQVTEKGKPFVMRRRVCGRCGGLGGGEQWRRTGWTCYQCGGSGRGEPRAVKLYTREQLERLIKAARTRAEKKQASAEVARAKAEAEVAARRETFLAAHGALLEAAEPYRERSEFVESVIRKAWEWYQLSEAQVAGLESAIARFKAEEAKKAASRAIGTVGERITVTVTLERMVTIETQFGALRIASMRTPEGAAIVSKGKFIPPTAHWNRELEKWEIGEETFTLVATVKAHETYREEKQTVVMRAREK